MSNAFSFRCVEFKHGCPGIHQIFEGFVYLRGQPLGRKLTGRESCFLLNSAKMGMLKREALLADEFQVCLRKAGDSAGLAQRQAMLS